MSFGWRGNPEALQYADSLSEGTGERMRYLSIVRRTGTVWEAKVYDQAGRLRLLVCGSREFISTATERARLLGAQPFRRGHRFRVLDGQLHCLPRYPVLDVDEVAGGKNVRGDAEPVDRPAMKK